MAAEDTARGGGSGEGGVSTIGAEDDGAAVNMAGPKTRVRTSSITLSGALCEDKNVKNI